MVKTYVIDTNVLIQAPYAMQCFEENQVVLPLVVLEELDGLKKADGERGANARRAIRFLEKLRPLLLGAGLGSENNARIFRELSAPEFRSAFHTAVKTGEYADVLRMIQAVVPPALHTSLKELLNGLD